MGVLFENKFLNHYRIKFKSAKNFIRKGFVTIVTEIG